MSDENIYRPQFRQKPHKDDKPPLKAVQNFKCPHNNILVDEKLADVECGDCGEKLNPIQILYRMAKKDERMFWQRECLRKEIKSLGKRLRFKCGSCGQVNNITQPLRTRTRT